MRAILIAGLLALTGCASAAPQGVGCPRLTHWSAEDQRALLVAYRTAEPVTRRAIDDLLYMRDQTRACRGT